MLTLRGLKSTLQRNRLAEFRADAPDPMTTAEQIAVRLQQLIGLAALVLVGTTWRLWTPGTGFPQIPWFGWACRIPGIVDWGALAGLAAACLILMLVGSRSSLRPRGLWLFVVSLTVLLPPSQQRLQPWAWEFLLMALVLGLSPPEHALKLLRWLIASIYVYSALSKLDVAFFHAEGQMLLDGLLKASGLSAALWTDRARWFAIGLFPIGELAIGIGLLIPALRRWAVWGSYVMHTLLLLTLGPLGLGHRPGVLIWNVYFIAQNWLLFRTVLVAGPADNSDTRVAEPSHRVRTLLVTGIITAAIVCPFLQNWGWFDVWPSWAVYSARPSQVTMQVREGRVDDLPAGLQAFVGRPEVLTEWRPVNLDAWSFAALNCPIYPQERFRIAVILAVAAHAQLGDDVRVTVDGPPNRWTGERESTTMTGLDELDRYSAWYWLNIVPRDGDLSDRGRIASLVAVR
jgi:Methylamine utilisation protein MauE